MDFILAKFWHLRWDVPDMKAPSAVPAGKRTKSKGILKNRTGRVVREEIVDRVCLDIR